MNYSYPYDTDGNITEHDTEARPYRYYRDQLDRFTRPCRRRSPARRLAVQRQQRAAGLWPGRGRDQLRLRRQFAYDANGHTIQETKGTGEVLTYHYNAAERLSEIQRHGTTIATYHYDPMGRRIRKQANGRVTWFQYADHGLIAEYDASGRLERTYGWQPQGLWGTDPVFLADVTSSGANTYWTVHHYHNDHLGTPQRLSDGDGQLTWTALAEAFGKTTPAPANTVDNPLRFPGQYYDSETGAFYNKNRNYQPSLARYMHVDPLGLHAGINLYSYVSARPLRMVDPLGLYEIDENCNDNCGRFDRIREQIDFECRNLANQISNRRLRSCIERRCRSAKVICRSDCEPGELGYNVGVGRRFRSPNANICIRNLREDEYGKVTIHEWAHSCGWNHNEGDGVPCDSGKC